MKKWIIGILFTTVFMTGNVLARFTANTPEALALLAHSVSLDNENLGYQQPIIDELISQGLTFSPYVYYNPDPWSFGAPSIVGNFSDSDHLNSFSIHFTEPVSSAGFLIWIEDNSTVQLTTLLEGTVVETVTYVNPTLDPPGVIGFVDTTIDEIVVEVGEERTILDYIAYIPAETNSCDLNEDSVFDRGDLVTFYYDCVEASNPRLECLVDMVLFAQSCRGNSLKDEDEVRQFLMMLQ
jgi:hypothetical protein